MEASLEAFEMPEKLSDLVKMAKQVDEIHEEMPRIKASVIATESKVDKLEDRVERIEDVQGIRDSDRKIPIELGEESPTGQHRIVPTASFRQMVRAYEREQDGRVWRAIKRGVRKHLGKALLALAAAGCTHLGHPYLARLFGSEESHEHR
jgi:hypothetical protein